MFEEEVIPDESGFLWLSLNRQALRNAAVARQPEDEKKRLQLIAIDQFEGRGAVVQTIRRKSNSGEDPTEVFIRMAKTAGFTVKQVAPVTTLTINTLFKKWKRVSVLRSKPPAYYKTIRKRHWGRIVELICLGVDFFDVCELFRYEPAQMTRFIETQCAPGEWKWTRCRNCEDDFVSFGGGRVCNRVECIDMELNLKRTFRRQKRY